MRNKKHIPFEVIEKAVAGEPKAIDAVLRQPDTSNICLLIKDISTTIFKTV